MKEKGIVYYVREEIGFNHSVRISDMYTNLEDAQKEYARCVEKFENREIGSFKEIHDSGFMTIFWPIYGETYNGKIRLECRSLY